MEKETEQEILTNVEQTADEQESVAVPPTRRRHRKEDDDRGPYFALRQILNIVFMVVAVIGCIVYSTVNDLMGAILVVIAMAFKMAECVIRFMKK